MTNDLDYRQYPNSEQDVSVKRGATHTWKVTLLNWVPNEYEFALCFEGLISRNAGVQSNSLYFDVLIDEPLKEDVIELRLRQRDKTELKPGQPVPLEIIYQNKTNIELRFRFLKGTADDLDLSDLLVCYGNDGRLLPLTSKTAGPMEIRVPVNGSFELPVDAPVGTVVARAVFPYGAFPPSLKIPEGPNRYWHWSEHWIAPSIRKSLDASTGR